MRGWASTVVLRRLARGWGLAAVVTAIAVLSCTVMSLLVLLLGSAETTGVRASLGQLDAVQSRIDVDLVRPSVSLQEARAAAERSVGRVLGDAGTVASRGSAVSDFGTIAGSAADGGDTYAAFAEFDDISGKTTLTAGAWPGPPTPATAGAPPQVAVAVPQNAAASHGMIVGSTFVEVVGSTAVTAVVAGIYRADDPADDFWADDALHGAGEIIDFPKPGVTFFVPVDAIGPLLVAPGALDAAAIPVRFFDLDFVPSFPSTTAEQLGALSARLTTTDLTTAVGDVAAQVFTSTDLPAAVRQISTGLTVTRSTVAVVAVLLTLLAVAALWQAARLFADSRTDDRLLARARGASAPRLFAVASIEAAAIGLVAAVTGPLVAALLLPLALAGTTGVPGGAAGSSSTLPADGTVWGVSSALALLFVAVLLLPLFGRSQDFADAPRERARPARASSIMRSGVDVGIVAVAAVLYWQLSLYRSPVRGVGSLAVDPLLVAGPAVVLLAGALLVTRVVPLVARGFERVARTARGMNVALASWQLARRSQSAATVILLLALTLGVGTFSLSYLATWRGSQLDQAQLAVGAPVVVTADPERAAAQGGALDEGGAQAAFPVIRRAGLVAGPGATGASGQPLVGPPATVFGLPHAARGVIDRDRLAALGGRTIAQTLGDAAPPSAGIDLPAGSQGLEARVRVSTASPLPGIGVGVRALIEDAAGLVSVLDFGSVAADGTDQPVRALLPTTTGSGFGPSTRFVGFQATFAPTGGPDEATGTDGAAGTDESAGSTAAGSAPVVRVDVAASVTVTGLAALSTTADPTVFGSSPLEPQAPEWNAVSSVARGTTPTATSAAGSATLDVSLPSAIDPGGARFALVGWKPQTTVTAVATDTLAQNLAVRPGPGTGATIVIDNIPVPVRLAASVPFAPGATGGALLTGIGPSRDAAGPPAVIVVDEVSLARSLAQSGYSDPLVDEWWLDVPADEAVAFVATHPATGSLAPTRSIQGLVDSLSTGPLRIASPAALQISVLAGVLFAAIGFALQTSGSLRTRRSELAHLRAIGVSRWQIVALIASESAILTALGVLLGSALGVALSLLVAPLIGVSPNGAPPLPDVVVVLPWAGIALLAAGVVAGIGLVVVTVAALSRGIDPARILRGGAE
ncbi:hypothetical protein C5B96_01455 [Subtercola sp. Z020]|uniref:ABC transporter permease n=1 Tax=Subtercola sp. Z020 TaxID=2080582 RepID=UPI000CE78351|nr:ABC transporter permease [Subtercola sp. Z020]PPF89574.1 hypothetical protein C5B96_01455 [Subtercola sp. Z020]